MNASVHPPAGDQRLSSGDEVAGAPPPPTLTSKKLFNEI
jgi:hypothetical protein